ncbi:MAG: efflux RND transporter periplasmic adaptor subunit [Desulfuromonadales bacterium]|nr:efflux RND transporter periplasmic adaptor subunit [Desulfuromonadales bacterium]
MIRSICLILCLFLLSSLGGCGGKDHGAGTGDKQVIVSAKDITMLTVTSASVAETAELVGTVRAGTSANVAARIPGTVAELRVQEGDRVARGQVVALLDAQETMAHAAVATAGIEEARRALNEARSRRQLAVSTFGRYERLFNEQAVTRQEFEIRQNEKELANQGVARAEARLNQARESSRAAASMAGYTRVTAPVAGIVTSRKVDLGSSVFPGQPLLTIENEASYQLELTVPESLSLKVKPGLGVQVSLDALDSPWNTRIAEVVPASDPASRTFIAKIPLNRTGIRSGLFGRGIISLDTRTTSMLLPRTAIVEQGGLTSVWVVPQDNRVRMRLVKIGRIKNDRAEILSGLQDGERVVVGGMNRVSEGVMVK